jgi:hypothetical protein
MSGSSRSRQKRKLEPISIEELAGTTGMSGFCSFLTRDSSIGVPALDELAVEPEPAAQGGKRRAPEPGATEPAAPETSAPGIVALASNPDREAVKVPQVGPLDAIRHETGAPAIAAPKAGAPRRAALKTRAPEADAPAPHAADTDALDAPGSLHPNDAAQSYGAAPSIDEFEAGAAELDASETGALDYVWRRRVRVREAVTVQDGHSLAEQAVYDAMYRAGKPYQGDSRILTIGLRTLAELSRMAYSNCKANVRSLLSKLAIDERPGFSYTDGRTYIIYSYREILRRRKAAGLTHVVRTRGVAFVDPATGTPVHQSSAPVSAALDPPVSALKSGAPLPESGAPVPGQSGAPLESQSGALAEALHIRNRHLPEIHQQEASSGLSRIVAAIRSHLDDVDDHAAAELLRRCLENAPEAEIDEIEHFIHLKAGRPGIRMPLGFLLTAVPRCFTGDSYRQFRSERQRSRESRLARDRMFAQEVLRSPEADEEQRQWALEVLASSER